MGPMNATDIRLVLPARLQKVSVGRTGRAVFEVYVHVAGAGEKRFVVVDGGAVRLDVDRPGRDDEAPPPAVQGLFRKELTPSTLVAVDDDEPPGEAVADVGGGLAHPGPGVATLVFARADGKRRVLLVERERAVLTAVVDEGRRILAVLGDARPRDGRDLRRGRLYVAPAGDEPRRHGEASHGEPEAALGGGAPLRRDGPRAGGTPPRPGDAGTAELRARLKAEHKRVKRLVAALAGDVDKHGDPAAHERHGELLKPLLGTVRRGTDHVDTMDWEGNPTRIDLDPALDGKQNLERFFQRAKKARAGLARATPRLEEARARLALLEEARARVAERDAPAAVLDEARALLARTDVGGSARRRAAKAGKRMPWRCFRCARDIVVRVGRGARDNDALVKSARGNDLWLHARDQRGAHVVIPSTGGDVDPELMLDAAHLAAHFSAARGEPRVDVQHARVKDLKKGPAPGLVFITRESVLHLRVDDDRVRRLLAAEVPA